MAEAELELVDPISADDDTLWNALQEAHVPSLMCALVHLTGDLDLLRGDIRPSAEFFGDPQAGISEAQQRQMRELAFDALREWRDGKRSLAPAPSGEHLQEMINFIVGQPVHGDYVEFLTQELALHGEDPFAPPCFDDIPAERKQAFPVAIIGAGMSGILAAIRLKEAGIPYTIFEKNADVGGTWFENTYPGCRVDSPNHTYSYSFAPKDWPQHFSAQEVLRQYFDHTATVYDLKQSVRFQTEVEKLAWDEAPRCWTLHLKRADGTREEVRARAVIAAVGQLNRPHYPEEIEGHGSFEGPAFHSAHWDHDVDLEGKRVGVIGTGASAFQFIPRLAERVASLTVFQRTPPWMSPTPEYHQYVAEGKHWLLNHVPYYAKWFRFWMFWMTSEGLLSMVTVDPEWTGRRDAISAGNDQLRELLAAYMHELCEGDEELASKVIPRYPPGAKRMLRDDGTYLRALKRDNVQLVTDSIRRITSGGLETDGKQFEFDVLIYGTGFHASKFLWPMEVVGQSGIEIHEQWGVDPRAYLGITVPNFPNLFMCYGPNTNIVVNGSIVFFSECEVRYILGCLRLLFDEQADALEVKPEVHDGYNERIDAANRRMAWGASDVSTWYKNEKGRITQNWPYTLLDFWKMTKRPDLKDFQITR